jgi:hypothetical protein
MGKGKSYKQARWEAERRSKMEGVHFPAATKNIMWANLAYAVLSRGRLLGRIRISEGQGQTSTRANPNPICSFSKAARKPRESKSGTRHHVK